MFKKLFKSPFFWPILLIIFVLPTFNFLIKPGVYWNMHDDMQMIRLLEMDKCLQDGQIPCRWTPDLGFGYGYPLFNFYPPLPSAVAQVFHWLGFSYMYSIKASAMLLILLSALAMYLLAKELSGPIGGFLAGLFYTYAPYRAVNIFVRGAFNEAWASLFFPLIFYFSKKLITQPAKTKYLILLSLSWSGLFLSHNPMALTFVLFFAPWCLYWYLATYKKFTFTPVFRLILAGILALALSAFFLLPVLFETKLVQIDTMFENYYHYSVHFLSLRQLFLSQFWGDGPSIWNDPDAMSYSIGILHYLIPFFILIYSFYRFIKKPSFKIFSPILIVLLALFSIVMTHERFAFLWTILAPIQKIQFPWRFLNHTLFLFSLSLAFLPTIINQIRSKLIYFIAPSLALILLLLNYKNFFPVSYGPLTDEIKFSGQAWTNQITSGIYDYLPKTASTAAKSAAKDIIDEVTPANTEYELLGWQKGTDWQLFNLKNETQATFTLSTLYFPNFRLINNGQEQAYGVEPELGRITVDLPPGQHQIYLKFHNTPIRTLGNLISLFSWIFVSISLLTRPWKKRTSTV